MIVGVGYRVRIESTVLAQPCGYHIRIAGRVLVPSVGYLVSDTVVRVSFDSDSVALRVVRIHLDGVFPWQHVDSVDLG